MDKFGRAIYAISLLVVISVVLTTLIWMQLTSSHWTDAPTGSGIVGGVVSVDIIPSHEDGIYCFNEEDDDNDGPVDCDDPDCETFCDPSVAEEYKAKLAEQ